MLKIISIYILIRYNVKKTIARHTFKNYKKYVNLQKNMLLYSNKC